MLGIGPHSSFCLPYLLSVYVSICVCVTACGCRVGQCSMLNDESVTGQESVIPVGHHHRIPRRHRHCPTSPFHSTCCQGPTSRNSACRRRHDPSLCPTRRRTLLVPPVYLSLHTQHHRHTSLPHRTWTTRQQPDQLMPTLASRISIHIIRLLPVTRRNYTSLHR